MFGLTFFKSFAIFGPNQPVRMKLRHLIGIAFISLQVIGITYARFVPERFFCWGPYDNHSLYEVSVTIDGAELSLDEVEKRYRYKSKGWEQRSMYNIFSQIQQYESTYGQDDNALVRITYSTNGKPQSTWTYRN